MTTTRLNQFQGSSATRGRAVVTPNPAATTAGVTLTAKLFRGLADPSRLAILHELRGGACNVGALVAATGLSQPNVSNHLACLLDCGLVTRQQRGRFVLYRSSDKRVDLLLGLAEEVLREVAAGIGACPHYDVSASNEDQP